MAEKPFKVGLLGLGVMGRRHMDAYRSLPGVEVLTRTSARFAHLQDPDALYEAMIEDPELDALDICLPTASPPWTPANTCSARSPWRSPWRLVGACWKRASVIGAC
jgi:hypothetical protein